MIFNTVKAILFLFILIFFSSSIGVAQNKQTAGGYLMEHYGVKTYGMHPRNFHIVQDKQGIMYFGNAYGVLVYDGKFWKNIGLPNGTSGLSLGTTELGNIQVGSYNELGKLEASKNGSVTYQSLYNKITPSKDNIGGIETIVEFKNQIIYQSQQGLYILKNNTFTTINPTDKYNGFLFLNKIKQTVFVQESNRGLLNFENGKLELIKGGELFKHSMIKDIIPLNDQILLVIQNDGLFTFDYNSLTPLNEETNTYLTQQQITHALALQNGNYVVATKNSGLYILSPKGNIIKNISVKNGLPNNSINYAYTDKQGGLWLALDNGIVRLEINSPFLFLSNARGLYGMGYTAAVFENKLYVGTSEGLYYSLMGTAEYKFQPVENVHGYVWDLTIIDNTLLCCQNDGVLQIKNAHAIPVTSKYDANGNWKFIPLKNKTGLALKGTYEGFQVYELVNGNWKFKNTIQGFSESCRVFIEDEAQNIWMCHGNKGMYKIAFDENLTKVNTVINYSTENGFAPDFFNDVHTINNEPVFSTDDGAYLFDDSKNTFIKHQHLNKLVGEHRYLNRLNQFNNTLCVFSGNDLFIYSANNTTSPSALKKITGSLVGSFEFAKPLNQEQILIGTQEGVVIYKVQNEEQKHVSSFNTLIRKIEAPFQNDSLLFGGSSFENSNQKNSTNWDYRLNALRFSFSAPYYDDAEKIKYQYALVKTSDENIHWSAWTSNSQVEFSNLWEGNYIFKVRAKNTYDTISEESFYRFTINPPWYRSNISYYVYALTFCILSFFFYKYIKTRFKQQKEKLEEEKKRELIIQEQKHWAEKLLGEKELIALRNEKLEAEVVVKNNELANLATSLTQKTEFLSHLKDKLEIIHKDSDQSETSIFKEVIKTIDQDLDFDDNWSNFQVHFDQLHHNFLHRLREQFPKLNPSWLLLCAYIRMNKSNKEISAHMNLSVAGVEKRKYRLREKLELDSDAKLSDFIANY